VPDARKDASKWHKRELKMFDKYMIVEDTLKNVRDGEKVTGFQLGVRLPYYRGVVLSLVGDISLTVDGERIPPERMKVTVGGKTYPVTDLENEPNAKWEFGEIGTLTVEKPGGLAPGDHTIEYKQHMKISYVPGGFWGSDKKVLRLVE